MLSLYACGDCTKLNANLTNNSTISHGTAPAHCSGIYSSPNVRNAKQFNLMCEDEYKRCEMVISSASLNYWQNVDTIGEFRVE